jgi:hypothetical protein
MSGTYVFTAVKGTTKSVTTGKILAEEPIVTEVALVPFRIEGVPTFSITTGRRVLVKTILCTGFNKEAV